MGTGMDLVGKNNQSEVWCVWCATCGVKLEKEFICLCASVC